MPNLLNSFGRTKTLVDNSGYSILSLLGAQKFDDNTVFAPGKYRIEIQAGASMSSTTPTDPETYSGRIDVVVNILNPFIIRAYCGSKASDIMVPGINLYSGTFKVNGSINYGSNIPSVNHIFGNAGSCSKFNHMGMVATIPSSGNCLGNGVASSEGLGASGAGSCLHFLPVGGVFGTDYLFAAHCTAGGVIGAKDLDNVSYSGASGSAYGGGGSGAAMPYSMRSYNGGNTPYGNGGTGVTSSGAQFVYGNNGSGIGHGFGGGVIAKGSITPGAAAYFDGTQWTESNLVAGALEEGKIKIAYVGVPE